jgi:hypothetical protein
MLLAEDLSAVVFDVQEPQRLGSCLLAQIAGALPGAQALEMPARSYIRRDTCGRAER